MDSPGPRTSCCTDLPWLSGTADLHAVGTGALREVHTIWILLLHVKINGYSLIHLEEIASWKPGETFWSLRWKCYMCYSLVPTPVLTYFATPGAHGYPFPEISQYHCTASFSIYFYFRLSTTWDDYLPQDLDEHHRLLSWGSCGYWLLSCFSRCTNLSILTTHPDKLLLESLTWARPHPAAYTVVEVSGSLVAVLMSIENRNGLNVTDFLR